MHVHIDLMMNTGKFNYPVMSNAGNGRHFGKSIYGQCVSNKFFISYLTHAKKKNIFTGIIF